MSEADPIPVIDKPSNRVVVEFETDNYSIGTARYTDARPVSRNLSLKPAGPGEQANLMCHANVRVQLRDAQGNEVPMTRRLVRTWDVRPLKGATVEDLTRWRIVGLEQSEFLPFSPFPLSPSERPGDTNFKWDRPGEYDAPGLQIIAREPFGILQEFIAGNLKAGGTYYQIYTLFDGSKCRTITTKQMQLPVPLYSEVLKLIDSGNYTKANIRKLFFMPAAQTSDVTKVP